MVDLVVTSKELMKCNQNLMLL